MKLPDIELKGIDSVLVALVTLVGAILVFATFVDQLAIAVVLVCIVAVAGCLALVDLQQHRLPNIYTGPLALFSTVALGACGLLYNVANRTPRAVMFGVGFTILFFVLHLVAKLGMGDVKYAYSIGFVTGWFGYSTLVAAFLVTSLSAAFVATLIVVVTRNTKLKIAYGPYMSLGLVTALVLAT